MRFFQDYQIDGSPLLIPDENVELTGNDLDAAGSGRDECGVMHRILVRSRVKTWKFSYHVLSAEEYRYLRSLMDGKAEFRFTFRNAAGAMRSVAAYCSCDSILYRNARTGCYMNFKFTVIEC